MNSRELNVAAEYVDGAVSAGHGERPAYLYEDAATTFDELRRRVNQDPAVLEAAVVGKQDDDELVKPKAFVVLRAGAVACEALAEALKAHVKAAIAPYQYPRWVEFCDSLPKTATGKIQRYKLRGETGEYSRIE